MIGSYKLDARTPIFKSNSDEDIETWLYKMETALEYANVPVNMYLVAISNYVEGTAFEMVMTARKEKRSWMYLRAQLIKTFHSTFKDFNLKSKTFGLKDGGDFE